MSGRGARLGPVLFAGLPLLLALAACAPVGTDPTAIDEALRPLDRKIVGAGQPYPADPTLRGRLDQLRGSMAARRAAAWEVVAKVLAPAPLDVIAEDGTRRRFELPRFRTWYGRDDVSRIFGRLWTGLDDLERRERATFSDAAIDRALKWNAGFRGSLGAGDEAARLAQLDSAAALDGLGGNPRVVYSPGFVRHTLRSYAALHDCGARLPLDPAAPPTETSFAPCLGEELPIDAVLVKASWSRADFGQGLPAYDTSAEALGPRCGGEIDEGGWRPSEDGLEPQADQIYSVRLADGTSYRMPAMHIVTKELRDWMWITLWWSPEPDSDFGADRPASMQALGAPFTHYKMNVVVAYDEQDADPRAGLPASLGDALASTRATAGGPSWASNPYLERGAHNAQTNCIGCHQHAGTPGLTSEQVLADPIAFPEAGRTQLRQSFPHDYVFAFGAPPERLVELIDAQLAAQPAR